MTEGRRRSQLTLAILVTLGLALIAGFVALGIWQVDRRAWKQALVARVDARLAAPPVAAPGPAAWASITRATAEYRRIRVTGRLRHDRETLVQAVTDLGSGFWVLTPLDTGAFTVLVNRGFVPQDRRDPATRAAGQRQGDVTITGLLRLTEPGGAFLRSNDPAADRWYSRDIAAIAAARGLGRIAPYFVDADATANPGDWPRGGLTQVAFSDNHLVYALTWFALAAMIAGGLVILLRHDRRAA